MRHFKLDDILKATGGKLLCRRGEEFTGLSIDSRTIRSGELFLALKGPHFDGHDFLDDALRIGAGAIVETAPARMPEGKTIILTESCLSSLQRIARHLRHKSDARVVGVTGTNGKTTTKELIASVLKRRHSVLKTSGNLNNHIGMPLCVVNGTGDEDVMVLEMGSNVPGDIRQLCEIASPDLAVITNVGPSHLEGFGSLDMVRKTDLEILGYVRTACMNADDRFLMEGADGFTGEIVTYGIKNNAAVAAANIVLGEKGSHFTLRLNGTGEVEIELNVPGTLNIYNALAAASVCHVMGVDLTDVREGLLSFRGVPMRLEVLENSGILVVSDVYNANPASMEEAVKELLRLKKKRTVAVLGDMLELGRYSSEAHRELVGLLSETGIDVLIAVGPEMISAAAGFPRTRYLAETSAEAGDTLAGILREGDAVLVKGSRGMKMERALPLPRERQTSEEPRAV